MPQQYAVLHILKGVGGTDGLGNHIDRSQVPANADPAKLYLNEIIVDHRDKGGLKKAVEARIKEGYTKPKALRKDAVKSLNIMLTGTHEQMKKIENNPMALAAWKKDNITFLCREFGGRQNIVSLALHRDERTPHIHAVVVPITEDGRLSAKDFIGNAKKLRGLQDRYGKMMQIHGLERGLKGSRAKHTTLQEYYARIEEAKKIEIKLPEAGNFELGKKYKARIEENLKPLLTQNTAYKEELRRVNTENIALRTQLAKHKHQLKKVHDWLIKIGRGDEKLIEKLKIYQSEKDTREKRKAQFFSRNPEKGEHSFEYYDRMLQQMGKVQQNQLDKQRKKQDRKRPKL